jgi:DNA-binding transcriptional LysR family regulator
MASPTLMSGGVLGNAREQPSTQAIWSLAKPSASYSITIRLLLELEVETDGSGTCNHIMALIDIIASGAGIALLPEILVRGHVARNELVVLLPDMALLQFCSSSFAILIRSSPSSAIL